MHVHEWLQGMLKYNLLYNEPPSCCLLRRLVYEHSNGLCHIVDYKKKKIAKATLMLLEYFSYSSIGPKLRFPTCPVYQNMTFPHISYTYLAEERAEFYANK